MLVGELMTRSVVTTSPETSIRDAIRRLNRHNITAMPVLDDDNRLVGIVSEADLLRDAVVDDPRSSARPREAAWVEPPASVVADVMSQHVVSVAENADVAYAARLMLDTGVKSIPVVHDDAVVGVVSRRDLIHALATTDDRIKQQMESLLLEAELPEWTVNVDDGNVVLAGPDDARDAKVAETLARTVPGVTSVRVATADGEAVAVRGPRRSELPPD